MKLGDFTKKTNPLAQHYRQFRVAERLLLTGHSHQAWPDCGQEAQQQAWLDAATYLDEKWGKAFAKADRVRAGFAKILDDDSGDYALAPNTHELVVRFLSALPLQRRPRLITTDGEYHTIRRQLGRLEEEGIEIVRVSSEKPERIPELLAAAVNDKTAAVLVSYVLFRSGHIIGKAESDLRQLLEKTKRAGAELLIDGYHALNVVPFSVRRQQLDGAYIIGGGYKYCQLGEGNCFLRIPKDCALRPVITGWYSEFSALTKAHKPDEVVYGKGGDRFAGATYDPTSHYRAARVFEFFSEHGLTPDLLRAVSQHQVGLLARSFDALDLDPKRITRRRDIALDRIGGFLTLQTPDAKALCEKLRQHELLADYRGDSLRLGPAPYLCDQQLEAAMQLLATVME